MANRPTVSIVTISYNHEKYIRKALDSFLAQKTNFGFEIIVADDASTDKTQAIIQKYANSHPDKFKPILRDKNVGAINNSIDSLQAATGKYIALCEGDDYWIDPHKLQRQVDFLEANQNYALCFHPVKIMSEDGGGKDLIYPTEKRKSHFTLKALLERNFIQTNSVMYRRQDYNKLPTNVMPLDWYLHLYHATFGKIGFLEQPMAVYRRHPGSLWWESDKNINKIWKNYGLQHLNLYFELLKLFSSNSEHTRIIERHINNMLSNFIDADETNEDGLLRSTLSKFPQLAEPFMVDQHRELLRTKSELQAIRDKLAQNKESFENQARELAEKEKQLSETKNQIQTMKASRFWKARNLIARLIGKPVI